MRKILFLSFLFIGMGSYAQTVIKGKVSDENATPVPGANIIIKGKNYWYNCRF